MHQLFTRLVVRLLNIASTPLVFTANNAALRSGRRLSGDILAGDYLLYHAGRTLDMLSPGVPRGYVAAISRIPIRSHSRDPIV